ncbi:MAG: hypothetical protein OXT64_06675 [Gammaproteobacteria bacterium]|nr:hypothetical protein [Gammaproteobacteria bacterium]MDE0452274.1 hypothetical protein [Gammaproteobacteria bacterium]
MTKNPTRCSIAAIWLIGLWSCGEAVSPSEPEASPEQGVEAPAALSDTEYLVRLGLMRGHLLVGRELYGLGALDAARSHSKHPTDELYAGMEHEFTARNTIGFGDELAAHALASEGEDAAAVSAAYAKLAAAMARTEAAVQTSPAMIVDVTVALLREAAAEYAIGVVDGKLSNAHEYQDAYGFTQIALSWAKGATPHEVFDPIVERIEGLSEMWPDLVPPEELGQKAARIYGVAAQVEILGLVLTSLPALNERGDAATVRALEIRKSHEPVERKAPTTFQ